MTNQKRFTKILLWLSLVIAFSLTLSACGAAPKVDWQLSVSGAVDTPTDFSFQELAELTQVDLDDVLMEKSRGEDEVRSFSGVPLSEIFAIVGAAEEFSSITAIAADGYAIEVTKDEITDGIVALKQSDEWIAKADPNAGPIRLVFPATPANRWVFQLNEIIVNP
jgi:DMSO/TMAO reductase YedYZ molybdopterin-dependent catalytic subunit